MTFVLAARRSLAERPSRISCVSRFAAVSASLSVAASVMPAPSRLDGVMFCSSAERLDLRRRAVDEHDADVQRAQHRHVQQQRGEVFVGDDGAVHREDERLLAELRNVLQDAPQVGRFHFGSSVIVSARNKYSVFAAIQTIISLPKAFFNASRHRSFSLRRADGNADPLRQLIAAHRPHDHALLLHRLENALAFADADQDEIGGRRDEFELQLAERALEKFQPGEIVLAAFCGHARRRPARRARRLARAD